MMSNSAKPNFTSNPEGNDATKMDLGDDLLQTRTIRRDSLYEKDDVAIEAKRAEESTPERTPDPYDSIDELIVNSKILLGEGLIDEAKSTLRRVLRMDPKNLAARDRLAEIQKLEIKRLLGAEENPRASLLRSRKKAEEALPEAVLADLEKEIGPGMDPETAFFANAENRLAFIAELEGQASDASAQDRIDLGIGFLEMEFYEVAIHQFKAAARDEAEERKARALLAIALLAKGNAFEAMIELESLVADQSISAEDKIDFGYLAGQAQEKLGNFEQAAAWYQAVIGIESGYRDAHHRYLSCLKKCERTPSSSSSRSSRS